LRNLIVLPGGVDIAIAVDGLPLPIYEKNGRNWIAGEPGKAYAIVVRHRVSGRIEVLESVDGRDVLRDQLALLSNKGMIITGEWTNHGWRIDDNTTRDFVFSDPASSIAAQATGSAENVGVIGVAIFTEKAPVYRASASYSRASGQSVMDSAFRSEMTVKSLTGDMSRTADLGTGMGETRHDSVGHTVFERANVFPAAMVEIQYRSMAWLLENGIVNPQLPSAWPGGDTGYGRYAK